VIDLHCHSTYSDGLLSPKELLHRAASRGVKTLALTDHDETRGLKEARVFALECGIQFIDGVEISVKWRERSVHIVGLNIDPDHSSLQQGLEFIRAARMTRAHKMASELEQAGISGSLEGATAYAHNKHMIGRPHFARFLCAQGHARDVKSVFEKYLVRGKPGYVAGEWVTLNDAVDWITRSGGIAVIAHPGRYALDDATLRQLISEFKQSGGGAIEVITPSHSRDQYATFARYATQFGLFASVGSDYHGPRESRFDLGVQSDLPAGCTPVWQSWREIHSA
jgi:3',5'-nucleoside bisphosphate phosphatase